MSRRQFSFKYDPTASKRARAPKTVTIQEPEDEAEEVDLNEAILYQEEPYEADTEEDDDDDNVVCYCPSRVQKQKQPQPGGQGGGASRDIVMVHGMESDTAATGTEEELLARLYQKGKPPTQLSGQGPDVTARKLQLVRAQLYGMHVDRKKAKKQAKNSE